MGKQRNRAQKGDHIFIIISGFEISQHKFKYFSEEVSFWIILLLQ